MSPTGCAIQPDADSSCPTTSEMICLEMWDSLSQLALKTKRSLLASGYNTEIHTIVREPGCQELGVVSSFPVCWDLIYWNWQYKVYRVELALVGGANLYMYHSNSLRYVHKVVVSWLSPPQWLCSRQAGVLVVGCRFRISWLWLMFNAKSQDEDKHQNTKLTPPEVLRMFCAWK